MGKRRRLNKLISKWLKSDLPDDRPSVLLLSATKLRTSPKTSRRPFSLPLPFGVVSSCSKAQVRRNSSVSKLVPRSVVHQEEPQCNNKIISKHSPVSDRSTENGCITKTPQGNNGVTCDVKSNRCLTQLSSLRLKSSDVQDESQSPPNSDSIRKSLSDRKSIFLNSDLPQIIVTDPENLEHIYNSSKQFKRISGRASKWTANVKTVAMETSVDSIGTCSLDMEASRELPSDWSESGSTNTLRGSSSTAQPEPRQHHHLPSYLSLACTVNGYCTTTNYDPERLARSRDASPHRLDHNHLTVDQTYSVTNNLLSPPNLVPLPSPKTITTMSEDALRACQPKLNYYSYTKTVTILTNESHHHYSGSIHSDNSKDSTDGCHQNREFFSYNRTLNGGVDSTTISKEYTNGKETKSFIQQRVERLYGPGALAQGFFVSKRQKNRLSESEDAKPTSKDKLNQTMPDKLSDEENIEPASMRQSSSTPSLPVLRHLRPEFRAQLPLASPKKVAEAQIQKSVTVPKLTDQVKVNGQVKSEEDSELPMIKQNGNVAQPSETEKDEKDGHYFLKILDQQAARLLTLADKVDSDIENPDLSEEMIGKLRSASGKARLLVSQKMQQFKGLCTNNINQSVGEAFPTTNQDLQGFWDMVMLQVDQVDRLFEEITRLKENNWKEETPKKPEIKTNGTTRPRKVAAGSKPKPSAAAEEARKQREEQRRKMIEERRKAMKAAVQNGQASIKIFVPESS